MRINIKFMTGAGAFVCLLLAAWLLQPTAYSQDKKTVEPSAERQAELAEGQSLFRGLCSGCHGGAGRGGKGPDLTDTRWIHGDKDEDIARIIKNGVPKTTMKKIDGLKEEQSAKLIKYIRSLARVPSDSDWKPYMAGDPKRGREIFFEEKGKAQCFRCHAIGPEGGRIGPPLDRIASRRSGDYVMESILLPSKDIDPQYESVQVETREGKTIVGLRVNESNFNIQLRDEKGQFYSFLKSDLESVKPLKKSMMPDNMSEQLTVKDLHDLFAYLMSLE